MKNILVGILLFAAFIATGCATKNTLQPGGGSKFVIQNKTYDMVWKATFTVVTRNLAIVESDKGKGVIKAQKGVGVSTWGEVVGVFITPANVKSNTYTVEVLSQKKVSTQVTGKDWEKSIIKGIKA